MLIKQEKGGIALILSFLILSVLFIISLAVSNLSLQQSKLSRETGESTGAYQAADAGMEYFLYLANQQKVFTRQDLYDETGLTTDEQFCGKTNTYWFEINQYYGSSFCLGPVFQGDNIVGMKVIGEYMDRTRRAIEIAPQ